METPVGEKCPNDPLFQSVCPSLYRRVERDGNDQLIDRDTGQYADKSKRENANVGDTTSSKDLLVLRGQLLIARFT